jgi:dipeptidyl-peptidase 4
MNTKLFYVLLIILLSIASIIHGQKREFQLNDPYTNAAVYPERIAQLQWLADENVFSWVEDSLIMIEGPETQKSTLITLSKINQHLKASGLKTMKRIPGFTWVAKDEMEFIVNDSLYSYNLKSGRIIFKNIYVGESEYIHKQPITGDIAFTEGQNLYIYSKGIKTPVTKDEIPGIVNGQTVARSEFGITHGIFWSPNGKALAYYHKDETNVSDYPMVNVNTRVAEMENNKYAMAGLTSEEVTLCIYDLEKRSTIQLKTGQPKDQYLTNITWSPDEKYVYIAVLNREQNHMKLNQYDAITGDYVKTLFEEKNERYVEPQEGLHFLKNSNDKFVWMSRRDGWNHAYLYSIDGKLQKQLTYGNWEVTEFLGFNNDNSQMFFMSTKESPIESHLFSINLKDNKINKLTTVHGTHSVSLSFDKQYFFDIYSNHDEIVREYTLNSTKKANIIKVLKTSKNPLADFNIGEMTISTLKAEDGTELYYRMIKPANFDPSKKYPVIVYVYGGPHAQMITDSWLGGGGYFLQFLATQGYVVFTLDNRGSSNRGFAFESIIHRNLGQYEMNDQMVGIKFLKEQPWVDADRIGVHGWSYGGFMTTSLMTTHAETFKVGVAGGPVIDWKLYEIMYGERYMDRPEENAEGYEASSLLNKAGNLKGRLLIIHGAIDPTVVWQHSLQFLNASIKAGTQVDYFVYPNHEHNVRGMDRLHLETKIFQYFQDFL